MGIVIEEMGEFFNQRAISYEAHMKEIGHDHKSYQRAVEPFFPTDRPVKVLDLGCGTGLELQYLLKRIPNAQVSCIDLSEKMLSILSDHYQERLNQLEIICDSYLTREFPEQTYDYVISVNTMHHLEKTAKVKLYQKIERLLKQDGIYVESDFMVDQAMMEQYQASFEQIVKDLPIHESGYYHIDIPFTVDVQKELLRMAGFGEVKVFYENIQLQGSSAVLVAHKNNL